MHYELIFHDQKIQRTLSRDIRKRVLQVTSVLFTEDTALCKAKLT